MIPEEGTRLILKRAMMATAATGQCVLCRRLFVLDVGWRYLQSVCDWCLCEADVQIVNLIHAGLNDKSKAASSYTVINSWRHAAWDGRVGAQ